MRKLSVCLALVLGIMFLTSLSMAQQRVEDAGEVENEEIDVLTTEEEATDMEEETTDEDADNAAIMSSTRVGCTVGFFQSCTTAAIRAHPTRHRIYVGFQDSWSIIEVFDVTGVRVYRSETGWLPKFSKFINGLYNWYYLKLTARDIILVHAEIASW